MDIYSAAKRMRAPFVVSQDDDVNDLPIGAHGVIGDGSSCALVRVDGAIDWLCMPRFDSPSVFASILDPVRGGVQSITPASRPFQSLQRYDPDTNVLETLFTVPHEGVARITDYMPWSDDPRASIHEIHRRIECLEGSVSFELTFNPRFDYGRVSPALHIGPHGILAEGRDGERLAMALGEHVTWEGGRHGGKLARFTVRQGQHVWCILSWGAPQVDSIAAYRPFAQLRNTRSFWRSWSNQLQYDGPWRHHVLRSALLLKLLQYGPTGAVVAAPTTSLPEWLGGPRNWDYRFAWARDSALCVRAANLIGYSKEARDFFHFVRDTMDTHRQMRIMYTLDGGLVPEEEELSHLAGYHNSQPVRIGNAAKEQVQLDNAGYVVDAAYTYEYFGGTLTLRVWRHLVRLLSVMGRLWRRKDNGIWEPRSTQQHHVHSKLMNWVGFERGLRIAQMFGDTSVEEPWRRQVEAIERDILDHGLDPSGKHFVNHYGGKHADATLLLLPIYGFLEPDDPRIEETIAFVERELCNRGFVYRYHMDDGIEGPEGAFVLCGFWLAESLAMAGRIEEAQDVFLLHAEAANHVGLLSEEIDPATGFLLGNFPQGFSHMGLINAAARIDLAIRLRDEKSRRHPLFALEL